MEQMTTTPLFPSLSTGLDVDGLAAQLLFIWEAVKGPVIVPFLRVMVVLCLTVSIMLFCERIYMSVVIVLVKLFGRKPDKRYKFEPLREDEESGHSNFPHVLIQIPMYNEKEVCHVFSFF